MRSGNLREQAKAAFRQAVTRIEIQSYETATLGWRQSATVVLLEVPGRPNFVYITKSDGTRTVALNEANVPLNAFLPVRIRLENDTIVIKGQNVAATNALTNLPPSPYGVPTHPHALSGLSDVLLTSLADGQILAWDATAGKWVNVTEAGALVMSVNGQTGDVVLESDDIAEGSTNLYISAVELIKLAGIETAADVTDQANVAAAIDGSTEATSFADANKLALLVASALRWISGANLKATLKSYFNTLYAIKNGFRGARVTHSANQSIPNATFTVLAFNSEGSPNYDTSNYHDNVTNNSRLTVPAAGFYTIVGQAAHDGGTGVRGLQIRLNGTTTIASNFVNPVTGASTDLMVVTHYLMAAGDYVELLAYQNSGAAANIYLSGGYTPVFSIALMNSP